MKYRSKTDIIGHILEAVNSRSGDTGLTKVKIMYDAFLSYPQLEEYLSFLLEKGLIEGYKKELQEKEEDKEKQRSSYYIE
jgi:predicted transcriptional regulator